MWKPEHRIAAKRDGPRYPSDMTDTEWALFEPLIPPAKRGGRPLSVDVHSADVQDRDGIGRLLRSARRRFPFVERIFADAGYQGPKAARLVAATGDWALEIVKRSDAHRFVVLPKRWVVERTFAWM